MCLCRYQCSFLVPAEKIFIKQEGIFLKGAVIIKAVSMFVFLYALTASSAFVVFITSKTGWTAKPGVPETPVITADVWANSPYRDFYTTRANWDASGVMGFVEDNPLLPNILLVGDSISMGYTVDVRQMFSGKANVYRIQGNGGDAVRFLTNYQRYLGAGTDWDLVHFNWGLHDIVRQAPDNTYDSSYPPRYTPEQYRENLTNCIGILKSTGAHLIWASTTPVPSNSTGRVTGDEVTLNAVAADLMTAHDIEINDLYALMAAHPEDHNGPGNVHFTGVGYYRMAQQIAQVIENKLGIKAGAAEQTASATLVNHWRFDDSLQDELTQHSGMASDQAAFGYTNGLLSRCLFSAGSRNYIDLGSAEGGLKSLSVTMWVKISPFASAAAVILAKDNSHGGANGWEICFRKLEDQTAAGIWWRIGGSTKQNVRYDRAALRFDQWHHVAVTFDGETGIAEIYIDAEMITRASGIIQSTEDLVGQFRISQNQYPFKGSIDELQIWDSALDVSAIKELFNQEGG